MRVEESKRAAERDAVKDTKVKTGEGISLI